MLEALGFGLAMIGFAFLSLNILVPGLIISFIGDGVLVIYGILTSQYWLAGANVVYMLIVLAGAYKYYQGT